MKSFTMNVVFAVAVVLFLLAPAFGAGGLPLGNSPSINNGISLSGFYGWSSYQNVGSEFVGDATPGSRYASAGVSFNVEDRSVYNAGWYFYTDYYNTSQFHAEFSVSGLLLEEGDSVYGSSMNSQMSYNTRKGVKLSEFMYLNYNDSGVFIGGNFSLYPAEVTNSYFTYSEYPVLVWDPDGGYHETEGTRWYASCRFDGHFLADTPAGAQMLGAEFAQEVPEPSTIAMLVTFCFVLGGYYLRRHKR